MKANELQINNFLQASNVQFVIPVYQRNYDWTNTEYSATSMCGDFGESDPTFSAQTAPSTLIPN